MQSIIPVFKSGQRVFIKEMPFEKPSTCCNRRYSCRIWKDKREGVIFEKKIPGDFIRCIACKRTFPSPENYYRVLLHNMICAVPYTWLTPVD